MSLQIGFTNIMLIAYSTIQTDLTFYNTDFWETMRQLSLKNYAEADFKKRANTVYSRETKFGVVEEKDPFLVFNDEKNNI